MGPKLQRLVQVDIDPAGRFGVTNVKRVGPETVLHEPGFLDSNRPEAGPKPADGDMP